MSFKAKLLAGLALVSFGLGLGYHWLWPAAPSQASTPIEHLPQAAPAGIVRSDLPPANTRSLFDHHIARLGSLPASFPELIDSLRALDRWGEGAVGVLIPDGRSLARGHADYHRPRVLIAAQLEPRAGEFDIAPIYSGRLFIGLVEALNTLEIISYNEAAGRFEFQLVEDYCAGCSPRIRYAKREVCRACHHSGSPIFSERPWAETNAHRPLAQAIASRRGLDWQQAASLRYQGVAVSTQLIAPESYDQLVGVGSQLNLAQRLWIEGCGPAGLVCRRLLLSQALALLIEPGEFDPAASANQRLRDLQGQAWPQQGIAVANDFLPSRRPDIPGPYQQLLARGRALWSALSRAVFGAEQSRGGSASRLRDVKRLPRLPAGLDPLAPRPALAVLSSDTLHTVQAVSRLFSGQDRALLLGLSDGEPERIFELIEAGRLDPLLEAAPLQRVPVLQRLAELLGKGQLSYCCGNGAALAAPTLEGGEPLAIPAGSALASFEKYCFDCHRGNPLARLNFMAGHSAAEVLDNIRLNPGIPAVLNYADFAASPRGAQLMPPPASLQRRQLEAAIAAGSGELEDMIEAASRSAGLAR